jgi:hypothetical protein
MSGSPARSPTWSAPSSIACGVQPQDRRGPLTAARTFEASSVRFELSTRSALRVRPPVRATASFRSSPSPPSIRSASVAQPGASALPMSRTTSAGTEPGSPSALAVATRRARASSRTVSSRATIPAEPAGAQIKHGQLARVGVVRHEEAVQHTRLPRRLQPFERAHETPLEVRVWPELVNQEVMSISHRHGYVTEPPVRLWSKPKPCCRAFRLRRASAVVP